MFKFVDLTLLKPEATSQDIDILIAIAKKYQVAGVCVQPFFIQKVAEALKGTEIIPVTVVGFPLGMQTLLTKSNETKEVLKLGAKEVDMVINCSLVKEKKFKELEKEIAKLALICHNFSALLKVIVETSRLTKEEIAKVTEICILAKADFIKTSTGFTNEGAKVEDIILMKKIAGDKLKIKASGGVKSQEQFKALIDAGSDRIGTSSIDYLIDKNQVNSDTY